MLYKKNVMKFVLLFIILATTIIVSTHFYIKKEEQSLLHAAYFNIQNNLNKTIHNLLEDKMNATLGLSILLSKDHNLIENIKNKTYENINYKDLSQEVKVNTKFKNVWIQVLDKDGVSRYRSWTKRTNVDLKVREDIKEVLLKQETISSISVGKITMSFKAICPIFNENNEFIGIIETITHFNSITKKLNKMNIDTLVLADKKYKKRLTNPYTKRFIQNYYVANFQASNNGFEKFLHNHDLKKLINSVDYLANGKYLYITYPIASKYDDSLGYMINRIKLSDINTQAIENFKIQTTILVSVFLLVLSFVFIFYIYNIHSKNIDRINEKLKKHIKQLKIQESKKQLILDSQSNIIVITDGENIINANKQLLKFFKDVDTLDEFKEKYQCICSAFVDIADENYVIEKDYNGKNWAEHILSHPNHNFKAAMFNHNKHLKHFSVKVSQEEDIGYIIVTLTDITLEIEQKLRLKYLNNNLEKMVEDKTGELKRLNESLEFKIKEEIKKSKEKDSLLFQQVKMTAIAETLKNIAHQWRQPLSVISTATSGMQIQKELQLLDDKAFNESCVTILENTKYLSKTIDDFTNFFIEEKHKVEFSVIDSIQSSLKFLNSTFEEKNIKVVFDYDKDLTLLAYKNEFQQAIVSILDNAIFAIEKSQNFENRLILIELKDSKLQIKDNGNGIKNSDLQRVFEPYFTTKHQAFGIGIGLYMVQEVLVKHMNYKIDIKNVTYEYKNRTYKGVNFSINFN